VTDRLYFGAGHALMSYSLRGGVAVAMRLFSYGQRIVRAAPSLGLQSRYDWSATRGALGASRAVDAEARRWMKSKGWPVNRAQYGAPLAYYSDLDSPQEPRLARFSVSNGDKVGG
jgi:hypothetical protein